MNIALGKPVFVSSFYTRYSGPESNVVDGNRHSKFLHTKWQQEPWIKIDLEREVGLAFLCRSKSFVFILIILRFSVINIESFNLVVN